MRRLVVGGVLGLGLVVGCAHVHVHYPGGVEVEAWALGQATATSSCGGAFVQARGGPISPSADQMFPGLVTTAASLAMHGAF